MRMFHLNCAHGNAELEVELQPVMVAVKPLVRQCASCREVVDTTKLVPTYTVNDGVFFSFLDANDHYVELALG